VKLILTCRYYSANIINIASYIDILMRYLITIPKNLKCIVCLSPNADMILNY
jgi:hypothetical protein